MDKNAKVCDNSHGVAVDESLSFVSIFGRDGVIIDALHMDMLVTEQLVGWMRAAFNDSGLTKSTFNVRKFFV